MQIVEPIGRFPGMDGFRLSSRSPTLPQSWALGRITQPDFNVNNASEPDSRCANLVEKACLPQRHHRDAGFGEHSIRGRSFINTLSCGRRDTSRAPRADRDDIMRPAGLLTRSKLIERLSPWPRARTPRTSPWNCSPTSMPGSPMHSWPEASWLGGPQLQGRAEADAEPRGLLVQSWKCAAADRGSAACDLALPQALKLDPGHWPSHKSVQALMATNQHLFAKALLLELIDERPRDGRLLHDLGKACFALTEPDQALQHFEEAVAINSGDADSLYWMGGLESVARPRGSCPGGPSQSRAAAAADPAASRQVSPPISGSSRSTRRSAATCRRNPCSGTPTMRPIRLHC